jgi:hypothetical protein
MSQTISVGLTPKIEIEFVTGNLNLVGWDGQGVLLKGDAREIQFSQKGETVSISCGDDLSLRVPKAASIFIKKIGGDAAIRGVLGNIQVQEIEGELSIRDVDSAAMGTLRSDFSLRNAKGHLSIQNALGDVSIRDVAGNVSLESVAADLALRDVCGNLNAHVAGDVVLYLNPQAGSLYSVQAGDDILLVMPPTANAVLTLTADEINVEWEGFKNNENLTSRVITLGDGSAAVTLAAGGDIRLTSQANAGETAEDFGNFAGIGMDWSGFGERVSRQVRQATTRATERVARRASAKVNVEMGRWNWDLSPRGVPMPPKPQVSEEERMVILKMLQEKKISAEDAEKLLSALEGGA